MKSVIFFSECKNSKLKEWIISGCMSVDESEGMNGEMNGNERKERWMSRWMDQIDQIVR